MTLTPEQRVTYERLAKILGPSSDMAILLAAHDALAAENRALREALEEVRQKLSPVLPMDEWMVSRIDDALRAKLAEAAPYTCPECGPHVKVDEDECCAACGLDAILTPTRPPEAPEEGACTTQAPNREARAHPDAVCVDDGGWAQEREQYECPNCKVRFSVGIPQ